MLARLSVGLHWLMVSTHHMMLRGKPLHHKNDARSFKEKTGEFIPFLIRAVRKCCKK